MATISIFIPVYNGERYLSRTLDSILGQNYRDIEVLCVDDSSTDGSYGILQEYAERDNRVRVFRKTNGGSVPPSWRYIIPHIQGEFTLYMSQDDLLESDTIELLVKRQQETEADAVIPHEIHFVEGLPIEKMHHLNGINGDITPVISGKDAFRLMIDYTISGRALWPTKVIKEIGIPADTYNADELAQRLWAFNCKTIAFSNAIFLYVRDNPQSITRLHSPRHYEIPLTHALLLQFAQQALPNEEELLGELANNYFFDLFSRMLRYPQHKKEYSATQRRRIYQSIRQAYHILAPKQTLSNWKYRISKYGLSVMQMVIAYKSILYKLRGIKLYTDIDTPRIKTPRKYVQTVG